MLQFKYLIKNYDLAKQALGSWQHDPNTLDQLLPQYRISSNAMYPFLAEGQIRFLRLAPTEEKLAANVWGELEFILYLNANGYPALKPVKASSGDFVLTLKTQWGTYYASVFERVAGEQIQKTDCSDEIMYQYGKSLGRLHALSSSYTPKIKKWGHIEVWEWIEKLACQYNAPAFVLAELDALKNEFMLLPMDAKHYGLIHYDFEPDNVFYDAPSQTCSVIDFDDGMYHWYLFDIDRALDCIKSALEADRHAQAKVQFIEGYKTEFPYSCQISDALPLMGRFRNLFAYVRLIRAAHEQLADEPSWMKELRKKIDRKLAELALGMGILHS